MTDMLVRLYDLPDDNAFLAEQARIGVTIRKPDGPEMRQVVNWAGDHFAPSWASETQRACANHPVSCFIAVRERKLLGFACYDATALGFFGPLGVDTACRGRGTGQALLFACLLDMKAVGYAYAVIGQVGPLDFYVRTVGAFEIPGSEPGLSGHWLDPEPGSTGT